MLLSIGCPKPANIPLLAKPICDKFSPKVSSLGTAVLVRTCRVCTTENADCFLQFSFFKISQKISTRSRSDHDLNLQNHDLILKIKIVPMSDPKLNSKSNPNGNDNFKNRKEQMSTCSLLSYSLYQLPVLYICNVTLATIFHLTLK